MLQLEPYINLTPTPGVHPTDFDQYFHDLSPVVIMDQDVSTNGSATTSHPWIDRTVSPWCSEQGFACWLDTQEEHPRHAGTVRCLGKDGSSISSSGFNHVRGYVLYRG